MLLLHEDIIYGIIYTEYMSKDNKEKTPWSLLGDKTSESSYFAKVTSRYI